MPSLRTVLLLGALALLALAVVDARVHRKHPASPSSAHGLPVHPKFDLKRPEQWRHSHRAHQPIGEYHGNDTVGSSTVARPQLTGLETEAMFARIRDELEQRNYSRPIAATPNSARGVDISQWCGSNTWSCLKNNGYSFAIVRNFQETCNVDPNGVHSVANAWAAGIAHVDIYLYPSYRCSKGPVNQVNECIDSMGSVPFGQLWFDIEEGGNAGPSIDHAWLRAAVNQAVARIGAARVGIYSSAYGWSVAMGSFSDFSSLPIWYAHYDNNPSYSDWKNFAGWTHPAMKQYTGGTNLCGFNVDQDFY
jgi:GH25 family lysozyme M1 (1,4-beta-N-acetylmuramidase)